MPVSVEVIDAINTISELSGGVSVDITQLPQTINVITDTVKQPLLQDRGFTAALLTCIGAIGGSLYMGWKTMQATREANQNQEKLAKLKFEQDLELQRLHIREDLASAIHKLFIDAHLFEYTLSNLFIDNKTPHKNITDLSGKACADAFASLAQSYIDLRNLISTKALYIQSKDIISQITPMYQRYRNIFPLVIDAPVERYNDVIALANEFSLCKVILKILKDLREDNITVIIPVTLDGRQDFISGPSVKR